MPRRTSRSRRGTKPGRIQVMTLTDSDVQVRPRPNPDVQPQKALVVLRESAEYSHELLGALVTTTFTRFRDRLAHSEDFIDLGARPLTAPDDVPDEFSLIRIRFGRASAALVGREGVYALYAMTSAAKDNDEGYNDFTLILCAALQMLRPKEVLVTSVSRLVRSVAHQPDLTRALTANCERLSTDVGEFALVGPGAQTGQMMLHMVAIIAASERDAIITRLGAGKITSIRRGVWLPGPRSVPLGYRLDADSRLVLDDGQADLLRLALDLLADPKLTDGQIKRRLLDAGLGELRSQMLDANPYPDEEALPRNIVRRLTKWLELYRTGVYRAPLTVASQWNPLVKLADDVEEQPDGSFRLYTRQEVGRPNIDIAVLDRVVAARAQGDTRRGGRTDSDVGPLVGREWCDGEYDYTLQGGRAYEYTVARRPATPEGEASPSWMKAQSRQGQTVAKIRRQAIHRSILDSVADGIADGVPGWRDTALVVNAAAAIVGRRETGAERASQLRADAEQKRVEAQRRERRAAAIEQDALAMSMLSIAAEEMAEADRLDAEADALGPGAARPDADPEQPPGFTTDAEAVLTALRVLLSDKTPAATADLLSQVVTDFSLDVDEDGRRAAWQLSLIVPADDGRAWRLGPFTGEVPTVGRGLVRAERAPEAVAAVGGAAELRDRLIDDGFPRNLATCAASAPGAIIARIVLGDPVEVTGSRPGFDEQAYARHIRDTWTADAPWDGRRYLHRGGPRQVLADLTAALGATMTMAQFLAVHDQLGLSESSAYIYSLPRRSGTARAWEPPIVRTGQFHSGSPAAQAAVTSVTCPECDAPATRVVRVLEVPGDLLCGTCLRAPADPRRLVFPDLYADLADDPTPIPPGVLTEARARAALDAAD